MKRGAKVGLICGIVTLILIAVAVAVYFTMFSKESYKVVGIEKTDYKVGDFVKKSNLKFFDNNTFHIHIEHEGNGLSLTGIGTYTKEGKTYNLEFIEIYGRDTNNQIVNLMDKSQEITCTRSGNRIKFTDHKYQIFYFG